MELKKEKGKNSGIYISVKIGVHQQESWWQAPPDNIDHVDLTYLSNRYPIINTKKRLEEFKKKWKQLFEKKYLILCTRHTSLFGDNWCLWWGCRESKASYSTDVRIAHRFTYDEAIKIADNKGEYMVPVDILGISENYEPKETYNENLRVLIEKGTLNELLHLDLRPDDDDEQICCPNCGSYDVTEITSDDEPTYFECEDCEYEFESEVEQ